MTVHEGKLFVCALVLEGVLYKTQLMNTICPTTMPYFNEVRSPSESSKDFYFKIGFLETYLE